ncbi:HNH endonuclease [Nocardioides marmoriginsengisoli]|uniref:HNH endonuclease n=1 Tax=Nocardioides marmoriginsengisoli TaxID=661483 RepID=A0A3N0CQ52_9ACTN|nr:HNH endonuclease signature motif containing protein [Nocardioides marmoriginsengisoli]RNL65431.1 HNH endonuclease [Nocardioides marmoriginsengisoli]
MTTLLARDVEVLDAPTGLDALHAVIDQLQDPPARPGRTAAEYDAEVASYARAIRRLEYLQLGVIADADTARIAEQTGMADTSSWLAQHTRTDPAQASRDTHLATALAPHHSEPPRPCATALADGSLSTAHAQVIIKTTEQLPTGLNPTAVATVEQELVEKATRLSPDQLRRVARRALAAIEPDQQTVDRHEDTLLRTEETTALARTRLTLHDNHDGTTSGHFTVPTPAAAILTKIIQSMTAPRRAHLGAPAAQAGDPSARRNWAHQSGLALVELLEHLPTNHLHSKVAATVVVTIDHTRLTAAIGAAGLDTGDSLSAGNLRRLACNSGILPAILDGPSLPLDLGRTNRLYTETQRVALATRHQTCAAHGCERPYAWCELHHEVPWSHGGTTNLDQAIPLCGFHHRRIHDPDYHHRHQTDGIHFTQRE